MTQQVQATPRFQLREFAPGWGATVMGTSVISTLFAALATHGIMQQVARPLATVFLGVAVVVGAVVISLMLMRWIRFAHAATADLSHPVKGGMSATFGGSFLTLAVAIGRSGESLIGLAATELIVAVLATIGGLLALVTGWVFLSGIFSRGATDPKMITGALFIPPVVTVIVPAAFAPLIREGNPFALELLWLSWAMLGIGFILYVVITAVLFYRTATKPLPPAPLAPSLFIGMGPAGLIALDLIALTEAAVRLGVADEGAVIAAGFAGAALWGFGLWWMVTSLFVIRRGYERVPFGLATWGFTFPLGAWSVAGVVLGSTIGSALIVTGGLVGGTALIVIWLVLVARTIAAVRSGAIFAH